MKKIKYLLSLASCIFVVACASSNTNPLQGKNFQTQQDGTKITLNFDKEQPRLFGKVVNTYTAPYEIAGDNITVGMMASTMMMPIGKAAEVEQNYFKFMSAQEPKQFKLSGNGETLTIRNNDGKEYRFQRVF